MTDPLDAALWRYLTGRPLIDRPGRWPYLSRGDGRWSGWQRQALRVGGPLATTAAALGVHAYPAEARTAAVAAAAAGWRYTRRHWRMWRFRRTYVSPTVRAIRVPVGTADVELHVDPGLGRLVQRLVRPPSPAEALAREWYGRWLEPGWRWPHDRLADAGGWIGTRVGPALAAARTFVRRPTEPETGPRIRLTIGSPYVTAEQRSLISAIVNAKVPVADLVETWHQVGAEVTAVWTPRKRPPARVGLADLEARFAGLADDVFYLGQGAGNTAVTISLSDDSPHFAVSAGTGAGKSVLAQLIAVQILRRGGSVVILDRKGSHRWALGLDGVDYCTRPEQMHHALLRAAELADQRNADALHELEGWDPGPRVLVIAEELNATINQLAHWWADNRDKSEPKRSPAITALNEIAFMGRSAKVHLLAVAQMLTARAIGGPEARENFGVRCLARYTVNAWKMLVPEAAMPRSTRTLGRWQVVVAGTATETQVCYLTAAEARRFARVADVAKGPDRPLSSDVASDTRDTCDITLREAVDLGLLPWKWNAARKRLERGVGDPPAPTGQRGPAYTYDREQLAAWGQR